MIWISRATKLTLMYHTNYPISYRGAEQGHSISSSIVYLKIIQSVRAASCLVVNNWSRQTSPSETSLEQSAYCLPYKRKDLTPEWIIFSQLILSRPFYGFPRTQGQVMDTSWKCIRRASLTVWAKFFFNYFFYYLGWHRPYRIISF